MKKLHPVLTDFSVPLSRAEYRARLLVLINHLEWLRSNVSWLNFQRSLRADNALPTVL
jgi:hypothetical protein